MKTLVFTKPSMPYNVGDVATFSDDTAERYLRHTKGIARLATERDIESVYTSVGKEPPKELSKASVSDKAPAASMLSSGSKDEDQPEVVRGGARGR